MNDSAALNLIRRLYDYHRWANRRLFEVAAALGPDLDRAVGTQFSAPTLKGMFAHIYAADWIWLSRWKGTSPARLPDGDDFPTFGDLRERWDGLEREQQAFVDGLTEADLGRAVEFKDTRGQPFRQPLAGLLQHVANHATHHRSEVATMLTMLRGSPPSTDLVTYLRQQAGRG
ncbi:MAG: DinB family protein [Candidatus Rokubacteria bacterium]|nr:DinB family protein [Candidatus Rokubacteria bacterium]